jgi:adenylate cyclase
MTGQDLIGQEGNEALWYQVFCEGHPVLVGKQRRYGVLPGAPRCKLCDAPFGGVGGWVMRRRKLSPSDRNPNYCNACDGFLDAFPGGAEVPMSMMMVDIRSSVELSARYPAREFARLVSGMREDMLAILDRTDGFVLEYQGDSVFAVWPPGFVGPRHAEKAIATAEAAVRHFSSEGAGDDQPPVGIGVHTGPVYIATISAPGRTLSGIGAFGLEVNVLARLAAAASPGEALLSVAAYDAAGRTIPTDRLRDETFKGIDHAVPAVRLSGRVPA